MAKWLNTGARFPGPKGKEVERGDTFEADENDLVVRMRINKLERVPDRPTAKAKKGDK